MGDNKNHAQECSASTGAPGNHGDLPKCEIQAKTKRLRQIVKMYGNEWFLLEPVKNVRCLGDTLGAHIISKCGKHNRWVQYPSEVLFY